MSKRNTLENLRHEATRLFADLQRNFPRTREILFTGCAGKEGVTSLAVALARAAVQSRRARVLLVDANFAPRNTGLTDLVQGNKTTGLRDLMQPEDGTDRSEQNLLATAVKLDHNIDVFTHGNATSVEMADLDNSSMLEKLRRQALEAYDFVFWDVDSINFSPDAIVLLSVIQKVILVVESDVTRIDHLNSSIAEIRQIRAELLAVLRNRAGQRAFSVGADQQ